MCIQGGVQLVLSLFLYARLVKKIKIHRTILLGGVLYVSPVFCLIVSYQNPNSIYAAVLAGCLMRCGFKITLVSSVFFDLLHSFGV